MFSLSGIILPLYLLNRNPDFLEKPPLTSLLGSPPIPSSGQVPLLLFCDTLYLTFREFVGCPYLFDMCLVTSLEASTSTVLPIVVFWALRTVTGTWYPMNVMNEWMLYCSIMCLHACLYWPQGFLRESSMLFKWFLDHCTLHGIWHIRGAPLTICGLNNFAVSVLS